MKRPARNCGFILPYSSVGRREIAIGDLAPMTVEMTAGQAKP